MRDAVEKNPNMSEQEARALIDQCLRILYYRDGRSFNRVSNPSLIIIDLPSLHTHSAYCHARHNIVFIHISNFVVQNSCSY